MLSVVLATHNGADTISRTLAAMSELEAPAGGWKLIVVNNASTDDTEALVLNWQDRLPLLYVREPRLGKPMAINTGFAHVEGDLVVMTDDDVLPDRTWLVEWRKSVDRHPECSVFGAAIVPEFETPPPNWLDPVWETMLFGATPDRPEGEIGPVDVCGGNMGIRRSIVDDGWRFDEKYFVGRLGLMGEDADFIQRLAEHGHRICFLPTPRVRHIIHRDQVSWSSMQRRFIRHGRYMFASQDVTYDPATGAPRFTFPRWRVRRLAVSSLALVPVALSFNRRRLFSHLRGMAYDFGALKQARAMLSALGHAQAP
ncbi:MAG: glycosyltransferase family 2 protein [Alphaproteobacteria bacterium]